MNNSNLSLWTPGCTCGPERSQPSLHQPQASRADRGQRERTLPQPLMCTAAALMPAPEHTLAHMCHVPGWRLAKEAPLAPVHGSRIGP